MKFVHLSDLHLGKRVNEYSMLEDQAEILTQILNIIDDEAPDGVLIAGDVYDKSVPAAEAVQLFDLFLTALADRPLQVFVISGNHDSPERLSFGARLMTKSGIHIAPVYNGNVAPISLQDAFGTVDVYLLPFVKPSHVRRFYEDVSDSYTDALKTAVAAMPICADHRSVLVTHQFVTGAQQTDSEELSVGGTDNVDVSVFDAFDYVALGHLHRPQNCGSLRVRYSGSPLKYSFSEAQDCKSVTVVELREKGTLEVRMVHLIPKRDLRELRGTYNDLMKKSFYEHTTYQSDYVHITLTDEEDILNAVGKLRTVYHNLMKLDYDNKRTQRRSEIRAAEAEQKTPMELFSDFYTLQNNQAMSEDQVAFIRELVEETWEEVQ